MKVDSEVFYSYFRTEVLGEISARRCSELTFNLPRTQAICCTPSLPYFCMHCKYGGTSVKHASQQQKDARTAGCNLQHSLKRHECCTTN